MCVFCPGVGRDRQPMQLIIRSKCLLFSYFTRGIARPAAHELGNSVSGTPVSSTVFPCAVLVTGDAGCSPCCLTAADRGVHSWFLVFDAPAWRESCALCWLQIWVAETGPCESSLRGHCQAGTRVKLLWFRVCCAECWGSACA